MECLRRLQGQHAWRKYGLRLLVIFLSLHTFSVILSHTQQQLSYVNDNSVNNMTSSVDETSNMMSGDVVPMTVDTKTKLHKGVKKSLTPRLNVSRSWFSCFYESFSLNPFTLTKDARALHDTFRPTLRLSEMRTIRDLLDKFHRALSRAELFYVMCSGTLLGSYRFHGIIPWDDDADVYVMETEKERVRQALMSLPRDYRLDTNHTRWKLYHVTRSAPIRETSWSFPFLDISFLVGSKSHVWDSDPGHAVRFNFKTSILLPITQRPFMGLMLNAPRNTEAMLTKTYNMKECSTNLYSHKREDWASTYTTIDCNKLSSIFPFVQYSSDGKTESLVFKGRTLYNIDLDVDKFR